MCLGSVKYSTLPSYNQTEQVELDLLFDFNKSSVLDSGTMIAFKTLPYDRNKTVPRAATGFRPRLLDTLWE